MKVTNCSLFIAISCYQEHSFLHEFSLMLFPILPLTLTGRRGKTKEATEATEATEVTGAHNIPWWLSTSWPRGRPWGRRIPSSWARRSSPWRYLFWQFYQKTSFLLLNSNVYIHILLVSPHGAFQSQCYIKCSKIPTGRSQISWIFTPRSQGVKLRATENKSSEWQVEDLNLITSPAP